VDRTFNPIETIHESHETHEDPKAEVFDDAQSVSNKT